MHQINMLILFKTPLRREKSSAAYSIRVIIYLRGRTVRDYCRVVTFMTFRPKIGVGAVLDGCAARLRPAAGIQPPSALKPPLGLPDRPRRAPRSAAAPANAATPRRHFRLEAVVFRRGGTDVPRANQRGRAALGRTQGPKPPTILAMGLLRPLQAPTAGADTAACPVWAVSGRHFRQNGREMEPILSAVWA